jgi:hypothetical protein
MNQSLPHGSVKPGINLEIEYLRAVAVLLVVFVHVGVLFPRLGLGQWTGVDLFSAFPASSFAVVTTNILTIALPKADGGSRLVRFGSGAFSALPPQRGSGWRSTCCARGNSTHQDGSAPSRTA